MVGAGWSDRGKYTFTEQLVTTVRTLDEGCSIRNLCSVGTERPGATRSVLYRAPMVVLGAIIYSLKSFDYCNDLTVRCLCNLVLDTNCLK